MERLSGVAQGAQLISFQVLNKDGRGTDTAVIAAINRAIALKDQYNIKVINLSLGRGIKES
jgi:serine protease AprX